MQVRKRHRRCPKDTAGGSIDILVEPWLVLREVLSHEMSTRFFVFSSPVSCMCVLPAWL